MRRHTVSVALGAGLVAAAATIPLVHHATGTAHAVPRPVGHVETQPADDGGDAGSVATAAARTATPRPPVQSVVALGDSVTAGEAQAGSPFPELVAARLSKPGAPVHATNFGSGGLTAAQLRAQVLGEPRTRAALATADVIIITIGANDMAASFTDTSDKDCDDDCIQRGVALVRTDVTDLLREVHALARRPGARVLVTTYWNVGVDGAVARTQESASYYHWTDQVTRAVNTALEQAAHTTGSIPVDLYSPFKGVDGTKDPTALLAADGDHPDEAGQQAIAGAILATLAL